MKRPSTQTILKVALLAVLATNVKLPQSMQELRLSSRSEQARGAGAAPAPAVGEPDDGVDVTGAEAPADDSGKLSTTGDNSWPLCGDTWNFRFSVKKVGTIEKIQVQAKVPGTDKSATRLYGGHLSEIVNDEDQKIELRDNLAAAIQERFCPDGSSTRRRRAARGSDSTSRTRSKSSINLCLMNAQGERFNDEEQLNCNREIIEKLDDLDSSSPRADKSGASKKFQEAVERSMKVVKKTLQSEDDDIIDDGVTQANELIATIEGMSSTIIRSELRIKMTNQIRAMLVGADTRRKALALKERTTDLNDQLHDAYKSYKDHDAEIRQRTDLNDAQKRFEMQRSANDLLGLYQQHNQLALSIDQTMSQNLTNVRSMQIRGMMSQGDLNAWMQPYTALQKSMVQMINPAANGAAGVMYLPQDPFYLGSANSLNNLLQGNGGQDSIRAALLQQSTTLGGSPLSYNQQQLGQYGLGTGSILGGQQQIGNNLPGYQTGINQNLIGPQRVNSIGTGSIYSTNGSFGNNGQLGVGALGAPTGGPIPLSQYGGGQQLGTTNNAVMFRGMSR